MKELIKESTNLYNEIEDCITNLIKSRLDKDKNKENEAIFKMETLLVNTMQHISWLVGTIKECSLIKWHTEEPKENGIYLVTTKRGMVRTAYWNIDCWLINNLPFSTLKIKSWCKLRDIETYKEETK